MSTPSEQQTIADYGPGTYRPEWSGAAPPRAAHVVPDGQGEARWWLGMLATIKATPAETEGRMSVLEILAPAGFQPPLHIHHAEDEAFHILEGEVTFEVGDATVLARPGDFLVGPRGVPHRFTVGDAPARMMWTFTPGGFERFVIVASEPAQARRLPEPGPMPDIAWLVEVSARHDIELLV